MSKISTPRQALDDLQRLALVKTEITSADHWSLVAVSRLKLHSMDVQLPALGAQMVAVNCGKTFNLHHIDKGGTRVGHSHAGHAVLFPYDWDSRWIFESDGDCITAFLSQDLIAQVAEENSRPVTRLEILPHLLFHDFTIERILRQLWHEAASDNGGSHSFAEALALSLAVHLVRDHTDAKTGLSRPRYGMAPFRLKRVKEFIEEHYTEDISLSDMARVAGMSLWHFAKSFHAETGLSPHRYLVEWRLQKACALLNDSDIPISLIAYKIGLHSQSHFTQLFMRHLGMTPRKFRWAKSG